MESTKRPREIQAAPPQDGARTTPAFLSLWSRADLADNVVSYLPAFHIARLSRVAKPVFASLPRILFAAARRRRVTGLAMRAFVEALATGEPRHFRETWIDGLAHWDVINGACSPSIVGTPPRLELANGSFSHNGLRYRISGEHQVITRFRVNVSVQGKEGSRHPSGIGYAFICGPNVDDTREKFIHATNDFVAGVYFRTEDGPLRRLVWLHPTIDGNRQSSVLVEDASVGWYCVDATFSYAEGDDRDGTVHVVVNGVLAGVYPFLSRPLDSIQLYNFCNGGRATYGDIDVWHKRVPASTQFGPPIRERANETVEE